MIPRSQPTRTTLRCLPPVAPPRDEDGRRTVSDRLPRGFENGPSAGEYMARLTPAEREILRTLEAVERRQVARKGAA